ncbi:hypothetical protein D3C78_1283530 [compost metagenome]
MQDDDAFAADALSGGSQGPAMISVGGTDNGEVTKAFPIPAGNKPFGVEGLLGHETQNQPDQRDGGTECLEAGQG